MLINPSIPIVIFAEYFSLSSLFKSSAQTRLIHLKTRKENASCIPPAATCDPGDACRRS